MGGLVLTALGLGVKRVLEEGEPATPEEARVRDARERHREALASLKAARLRVRDGVQAWLGAGTEAPPSLEPEDAPMLEALGRFRTDVPDPELALWLIDTVSHAVIHRAVVERPEALSQGLLQEELVTLLLRYLKRK